MVVEVFLLGGCSAAAGVAGWRLLGRNEPEIVWRELHWPRRLDQADVEALLRQLAAEPRINPLVFEASGTLGSVSYRVGAVAGAVYDVERLVRAFVDGVELTPSTGRKSVERVWQVVTNTRHRPFRRDDHESLTRGLLAELAAAREGEYVALQWRLGRRLHPKAVMRATPAAVVESFWRSWSMPSDQKLDGEARAALADKNHDLGFATVARIGVTAKSEARQRVLLGGVLASLRAAEAPGLRIGVRVALPTNFERSPSPLFERPFAVNAAELAGLVAWPLGESSLPGHDRTGAPWIRPSGGLRGHGRVVARSNAPGKQQDLGLSASGALQHLHVLGPTGVGKSTLLLNLIAADVAAGRGVVVVDPKGDLVDDVLARIPAGRIGDVVVIDPSDAERPVGLNPLAGARRDPELVADQVLAVFHGLYEANWGPRTQDILHAALLSLASSGETSLCALPVLLTNPGTRRRLIGATSDPIALGPFWAWFEGLSEGERHQTIAPVMNKLRAFLLRPRVRAVLGQVTPKFRMSQVFTERKIILVSLAKGTLGPEASALLGSLVVAELWHATLGRVRVPASRRHPVMVFIDEFQDYLHLPTDLADALAQARGLGVGLTLAHQHLAQLSASMRSNVLANARSRVCFQLAHEDAAIVSRGLKQPTLQDFQRLRAFEVYLNLVSEGRPTGYASGRTLPAGPVVSDPAVVRAASRERYGVARAEIEASIEQLVSGGADGGSVDGAIGSRPRRRS